MSLMNSREEDDSLYYEILHVLVPRFLRVLGDGSELRKREAQSQLSERLGLNANLLSVVKWFHSASFMSLPGYLSINDIDPSSIGLFPIDIASACAVNAMSICGYSESVKILDLCCCPGGKTQMIYDSVENQGKQGKSGSQADVLIVGVDISQTRLHVCTSLLSRTARYKIMEISKHRPGATKTDSRNPVQPKINLFNSNDESSYLENHKTEEGVILKSLECALKSPHLMIFHCDGTKFGAGTMGTLIYDSVVQECELQHTFRKERKGLTMKRNGKVLSDVDPLMIDTLSKQSSNNDVEEEDGGRKRKNKSARHRENKMLRLVEKNGFPVIFCDSSPRGMHAALEENNGNDVGQVALSMEAGEGNKRTDVLLKNASRGQTQPLQQPLLNEGAFDFVLVDAECSHDGSYRHMRYVSEGPPDQGDRSADHTASTPSHAAAWTGVSDNKPLRTSSYVRASCEAEREKIVVLQKQLLANGFRLLRASSDRDPDLDSTASPCLVYSTCSLERSQNEEVVQWLLDTFEDAELCPLELSDLCGLPPCKGEIHASETETQRHPAEQQLAHGEAQLVAFSPLMKPQIRIIENSSGIKDHAEIFVTECEERKEASDEKGKEMKEAEEEEEVRDLNRALALIALSQPDLLRAVDAREYTEQHLIISIFLLYPSILPQPPS